MPDKPKMETIRLTQFSHGSGCGCKIAPALLREILNKTRENNPDKRILVGNDSLDDAAVVKINNDMAIISTTDFFTPIVDDPEDFGAIAAVNALSDIYAMGGEPLVAISILGWPVDKLSADMASRVVEGAKKICAKAGINIAGGHSIDTPEPIFGLAVTGTVHPNRIKRNKGAQPGNLLYLTKPLGIGIYTTAQKKGVLSETDKKIATDLMLKLNDIGPHLGKLNSVTAMTDVTGFGLLGHLYEMCDAAGVSAEISYKDIPVLDNLPIYVQQKCIPGGTHRNYSSYRHKMSGINKENKTVLCDPQTSGGLLLAVDAIGEASVRTSLQHYGLSVEPIGKIIKKNKFVIFVQ